MKSFHQFLNEIKTIKYPMAKAHKVYLKGKVQNVPAVKQFRLILVEEDVVMKKNKYS